MIAAQSEVIARHSIGPAKYITDNLFTLQLSIPVSSNGYFSPSHMMQAWSTGTVVILHQQSGKGLHGVYGVYIWFMGFMYGSPVHYVSMKWNVKLF